MSSTAASKTVNDERSYRSSPSGSEHISFSPATSSGPTQSPVMFAPRPRDTKSTNGDDPSMFAVCHLCQNKIMSSRFSNLTNHVRRHATLKQFRCLHCPYTHNEMAKVRLFFHFLA